MVALVLSLVCSALVSTAAVMLKPLQTQNVELNRQTNILRVAGLLEPDADVEELFGKVTTRVVDLTTGKFVDAESLGEALSETVPIPSGKDIASIREHPRYATVYLVERDSSIETIILPMHGYGLWSTMYGFLALEGDGNTIRALQFYQHAETPGLGAEIDNPNWLAQFEGRLAFDEAGSVRIAVIKGAAPDDPHAVDSIAGATLTANGVSNMLRYWLGDEAYGPFLAQLRQ